MNSFLFLIVFVDTLLWFGMFFNIRSQKDKAGGWFVAFLFAVMHASTLPTLYHLAFPSQ